MGNFSIKSSQSQSSVYPLFFKKHSIWKIDAYSILKSKSHHRNIIVMWKDLMLLDSKRNKKILELFNLAIVKNALFIGTVLSTILVWNQNILWKLSPKVYIIQSFSSICVHFGLSNVAMIKLLYCRGLGSWIRAIATVYCRHSLGHSRTWHHP